MKKLILTVFLLLIILGVAGCGIYYYFSFNKDTKAEVSNTKEVDKKKESKEKIDKVVQAFNGEVPTEWGESIEGVTSKINTDKNVVFLTFDACGGPEGSDYDKELIEYLKGENIEATLFINSRWIDSNPELFKELASNPLFEIENHGYEHRPLSVNGREIYNIKGTGSLEDACEEIEMNASKIEEITGRRPKFFRSGTAYYDNVAIKVAKELGSKIGGFTFTGDAGATFTKDQIITQCEQTDKGDILLFHMNQPQGDTYEGLLEVIPMLRNEGFTFGKLEDYVD